MLTVTGYPTTTTAGASQSFTVSERNAQGQLLTTTTDTIHFTSTDPRAVLPLDYTFTAGDGGQHTFTATFKTAGVEAITATDLSCCLAAYEGGIQVQPGPAASLSRPGVRPVFSRPGVRPVFKSTGGQTGFQVFF